MISDTAILVFARSASEESKYKRFCVDPVRNEAMWTLLSERALRLARATPYPVYHFTEAQQRGTNFGERISHAAAAVFARGHEHLIILGSDCPTVTAGLLRRAADRLRAGTAVLGPDRRGGAYLIGLRRREFSADQFTRLPWQTSRILAALRAQLGTSALISPLRDLNYRSDLLRLSGFASRHRVLARLFLLLFGSPRLAPVAGLSANTGFVCRRRTNRGPPRRIPASA